MSENRCPEESVSEELKADLKHIVDLAESVPERYRDPCFELLLISALDGTTLAVFEESIIEPETVALITDSKGDWMTRQRSPSRSGDAI